MDRVKFKEKAKKMIEGNKWYIWKPLCYYLLIAIAIALVISVPCGIAMGFESNGYMIVNAVVSSITSFIGTLFMFGYAKYCLDFVRGKKEEWSDPFKFGMKFFVPIILIDLLMSLNVIIGCILLVVPGIIAALGLSYVQEVFADNQKLSVTEALRKSWDITNGHKCDLFILGLSFLGWSLLVPFTLGILLIWLFPYMTITYLLVYEDLVKKAK